MSDKAEGYSRIEEEIDQLRLIAFRTNLQADRMAYYKACSGYFQEHHARALLVSGLEDRVAAVEIENARLKSERLYIVGWNDGFEEAKYQGEHGHPSDGDIAPQYQFTAAEMAAVKAERDNYKALYEAERDDELLNIARQAGYQDGAEDRRKLEARVKALTAALEFYADEDNYEYKYMSRGCDCCTDAFKPAEEDSGERARAALQENTDATNP